MRKALIIKFGAIGDVVMAIPAAYALFQTGYTVDWLCGAQAAEVLALYPWVRTLVADDRGLLQHGAAGKLRALARIWRKIAVRQYDLCATLYYDPRYRLLAGPVRARRKIMLSTTERRARLLTGRHHTDEYARILLGRQDGFKPDSLPPLRPPTIPTSPLPRSSAPRVILVPAGAKNMLRDDALRRWPLEHYVGVAKELKSRGVEVVLSGGPDDQWASSAFAGTGVIDLIGRFSLSETIGLLDGGDVLLTHDTGPMHLAGITSIAIVAIFGPTDPAGRLPQRANAVALWGGEGFACRPCYDGRDYAPCTDNGCMRQVTIQMAIDEVLRMISQRGGTSAAPRIIAPESRARA